MNGRMVSGWVSNNFKSVTTPIDCKLECRISQLFCNNSLSSEDSLHSSSNFIKSLIISLESTNYWGSYQTFGGNFCDNLRIKFSTFSFRKITWVWKNCKKIGLVNLENVTLSKPSLWGLELWFPMSPKSQAPGLSCRPFNERLESSERSEERRALSARRREA